MTENGTVDETWTAAGTEVVVVGAARPGWHWPANWPWRASTPWCWSGCPGASSR
ncbi:hypothetical protein ACFQ1I_01680 [Kitasatospora arboriphila]